MGVPGIIIVSKNWAVEIMDLILFGDQQTAHFGSSTNYESWEVCGWRPHWWALGDLSR